MGSGQMYPSPASQPAPWYHRGELGRRLANVMGTQLPNEEDQQLIAMAMGFGPGALIDLPGSSMGAKSFLNQSQMQPFETQFSLAKTRPDLVKWLESTKEDPELHQFVLDYIVRNYVRSGQ